jgi:putative FmdB family regulatory protein
VPLYEYVCKKCKHRFEKIQKFSDRLVKKCPECGGPVERPLSAPAVHFKGSGFYVNDYNARKGGGGDGDSGGTTREKREKEEKKQEASEKSDKANKSSDKADKSEDKPKKSTAKKSAEKD